MTGTEEQELLARIDAWDPESGDLPDDLALALDASEALRARFDARFARWEAPAAPVPEGLAQRVMPRRPRSVGLWVAAGAGGLAVAAAALLVLGGALTMQLRSPRPEEEGPEYGVVASPPRLRTTFRAKSDDADAAEALARSRALRWEGDPSHNATESDRDGFLDPGIQGWWETADQPSSTFSIDVDRASFTYGRRRLRSGFLPDPASVRVEEWVNAFTYDYPEPDDGPFAVQFEASPSPFVPRETLVRIGVAARRPAVRLPVHLTFLVDTSGSMVGPDRLELVKQALGLLVTQLGPDDTVAIVAYAGAAGAILPPTSGARQDEILAALERLQSGGSTAMGQGIELAYRLARDHLQPGSTNRVVLASDGDCNVGVTDTAALTELIRGYARRGITLTTLGFGEGNLQDGRMEQLADDGDGAYYYVDGVEEARHIFVDELASTMEVVARDVKIQVDWNAAAVARYRLVGYENRALANEEFRDDRVDAGEVGAGHTVTALYAVELQPGSASPLATVRVRSKPPGPDAPSTERSYALVRGALQPSFAEASRDHRLAVAVAALAERLRRNPEAESMTWDRIADLAEGAIGDDHPENRQLLELIHRARQLAP